LFKQPILVECNLYYNFTIKKESYSTTLIVKFECLLNFIEIEHEFWTFNKFQNLNKIQQNQAKQRPHKSFHSYIKITQCLLNTSNLEIQ
jgi:hypothetical protein